MLRMLFIPGIKGTELIHKEDNVWFPKNKRDMETLSGDEVEPGNLLRSVSAFSYIHVDIYKGILDNFEEPLLIPYTYDWRKDITIHVNKLVKKILEFTSVGDEVVLVAHSMGGMLAKLAILELQKENQLNNVKKLITLGTPWHGAPDAYKVLTYGEPGIFPRLQQALSFLNDKSTRKMARQFTSVYQLLPSEYYFNSQYGKFLYNPYKDHDYADILQDASGYYKEDNEEFVDIWLKYMKPVQDAMLQPLPDGFVHDCLIGHCYPTLYQVPEKALLGMRIFFKSNSIFMNGDGVVPIFSAKPTHSANMYYVEGQHGELGSNPNVIDFIKWSLDEKNGEIPNGIVTTSQDDLHNGFMARIKCPVDPTFLDQDDKYVAGQFDPTIEEVSELSTNPKLMYFSIGDSKYLFIPEDANKDIKIKLTSYEKGIADISLQILNEEITEINFEPLPIDKGETALISLPLTQNPEKPSLKKSKGKAFDFVVKKKTSLKNDMVNERPFVPTLEIIAKPTENVKKFPYREVYSGPITITVNINDKSLVNAIYVTVDGEPPTLYIEPITLDLIAGKHKIEVFGKDIYERPLKTKTYEFSIDTEAPTTKPLIIATPDGMEISFSTESLGTKVATYYRIVNESIINQEENIEWNTLEIGEKVNKSWGALIQGTFIILKGGRQVFQ
ncbi:MAG: hypothetical protein ACE3L7_00215 [Candidatus Pristimantibacillus sp.]